MALVAPLVATPLMLTYFGDADFGVWATAVSLTSMAVFSDLGIGNSLLTRIATASGQGRLEDIQSYIASAYVALCSVAGVAMVLLPLICGLLVTGEAAAMLVTVLVIFFAGLPGTIIYQILYGLQRVPFSNLLLTIGAVLSVLCSLVAIGLKLPNWAVAAAYGAPPILVNLVGAAVFFALRPEFRPGAVRRSHLFDLLKLGARFAMLSALTAIGLNLDNVIIAAVMGSEAVAAYAVTARLGSILSLLILTLFMPLWGASAEALARGDYAWVARTARRMSLFGAGFVSVAGICLVLASGWVMELWVGRIFPQQHLILIAIIATSTIVAATSPYNMILNAFGRITVQVYPWAIFVVLSAVAKVALAGTGQMWLVAAATGIAYAVVIAPVMVVAARRGLREHSEARGSLGKVAPTSV
ncbi:lipopolysaccharide biosynthesis protein [Devosia sp. Root413D1]|uniref:lipopolysaccharide biosynthesis protein n=1 Tax=Devosia sp. Root413D1 TaxID=1736531 RepID=UPI000B27D81E|nr:oligosaccharide flippase family protein [Devosia sp. Root413D1]